MQEVGSLVFLQSPRVLMEAALYTQMADVESRHWWFVARRQIVKTVLRKLALPPDAEVLEIGAGTGGNLEMLSGFGKLTAIELSESARDIAKEKSSVELLPGSLPDGLPPLGRRFDLVVLMDVLEHVEHEVESLQVLSGLLKPGGFLLLTVPAFQSLWSEHDEVHHHFRRYRYSRMRKLVNRAGLEVVIWSYFNTLLSFPIAAIRFAHRLWPRKEKGTGVGLPSPGLNRFLRLIFSSERHVVGRYSMPFGVSLLVVARLPNCAY